MKTLSVVPCAVANKRTNRQTDRKKDKHRVKHYLHVGCNLFCTVI